jgi:hypothetical protein
MGRSQGSIQRDSKNVSTSTVVVSPDPLCPTPTSSAIKPPANTTEEPDDPEPADKGDMKMEYSSD